MKKINKYIYIIGIALLAAVAFQGCELESEDYGTINTTLFPKTAADAEALVTQSYYLFDAGNYGSGIFNLGNSLGMREWSSDFGATGNTPGWRAPLLYVQWENNTSPYVSELISLYWDHNKSLSAITLNIDRISAIDMDETRKKQLIAELHCARGFMAFLLYDAFGPVPLPTLEALKNPLEEQIFPRATEEEMQTFIEDDLWAAINSPELPDVYHKGDADYGRFSRGIAYFVLLKHYMQCGKWTEAVAAGEELVNNEDKYGYGLMNTYADVFTLANEKNKETIFSSCMLKGYEPHEHGWYCAVLPAAYPAPDVFAQSKFHMFLISWWFVHTFDPADPRGKDPILIREFTGTDNRVHNENNDNVDGDPLYWGAIPLKYDATFATATGSSTDIDFIIYRYADALTLLAEAYVRKEGAVTQKAVNLLNEVRTRSLPGKGYSVASLATPQAFYDAVLNERGWELYWEGCRRQDLVRHGKYVTQMEHKAAQMHNQTTVVTEDHERFPIPQSVINEGKGIILQNPGY